MCGIAGYVWSDPRGAPILQTMVRSLVHRGPDETGHCCGSNFGIACARLSIIDPLGGTQPFYSLDGNIAVVQNGEIYNFIELRDELRASGAQFTSTSDTEVILRAYEAYGPAFVSRLNGMFAIAIVDQRSRKLHLYRDRLGVKPLFIWRRNGGGVFFASEIKSFIDLPGFSRDFGLQELYDYFVLNYVPLPKTIFKDVVHVSPGSAIEIGLDDGCVSERSYWSLCDIRPGMADSGALLDELECLILDSVKIRLRSDVGFGAFLSGGSDSSLICAVARRLFGREFPAFCIGFPDPAFDESSQALRIAEHLGIDLRVVQFAPKDLQLWGDVAYFSDQPHGDVSFVPLYALSEVAASSQKMVLTGDGGDELFGGYTRYLRLLGNASLADYFATECRNADFCTIKGLLEPGVADSIDLYHPDTLFVETCSEIDGDDYVNKALYFDMRQLLPGNNLVKTDRATMAHSLEARSPLMDYRLVERLFSVPGKEKIVPGTERKIQRDLLRRILPLELLAQKKQMLSVPIGEWWKGQLQHSLRSSVSQNWLVVNGYLKEEALRALAEQHISGSADRRRILRAVIAFDLWARRFLF